MEFTRLGGTGITVSRLCYGAMSFGGDADEGTSEALFRACRDAGINFFDSADIYTGGRSEEILGKLIADCRDEIVLTSKVFGATGEDVNARGLSRRHIMLAVEASLKRLGTDRIDIYFAHQIDPSTPIEVTVRAMDDLVRQGKILHPAVSNWPAWRIAKALGIAAQEGRARIECLQPMYNLVKRQVEVEILPLAEHDQIGVIPYNPIGGGLLSGKYGVKEKPASGRLVENKMYAKRYAAKIYYEIADRFCDHARERGVHPVTLAVAWAASHPAVTAPIIGARNPKQLEPALKAFDLNMTPEWRSEIAALSIEPPMATDQAEKMVSPSRL